MNNDNEKIEEYEPEFEAEWERTKRGLPEVFKDDWQGEANVKCLCYGFYLYGRRVSSEACIKQLREHGHI
jgi:hypothetical protein